MLKFKEFSSGQIPILKKSENLCEYFYPALYLLKKNDNPRLLFSFGGDISAVILSCYGKESLFCAIITTQAN